MTVDIAELRRLHGAATAGEWESEGPPHNVIIWSAPEDRVAFMASNGNCEANASAIVALHNAAPALLDAADRLARIEAVMAGDEAVEAMAAAIERACCHGREGPFGGYDYGHNNDNPPSNGRYVVRDFRDPMSSDWGKWIHQTDDAAEHERVFGDMTKRHKATAALAALRELIA